MQCDNSRLIKNKIIVYDKTLQSNLCKFILIEYIWNLNT